jgi:hypothetical protein
MSLPAYLFLYDENGMQIKGASAAFSSLVRGQIPF